MSKSESIEKITTVDFSDVIIPDSSIVLNNWELITDVKTFIKMHNQFIQNNPGSRFAKPYHDRLVQLHEMLKPKKINQNQNPLL